MSAQSSTYAPPSGERCVTCGRTDVRRGLGFLFPWLVLVMVTINLILTLAAAS